MTLLLLPLALVEARVLPCLDLREITRLALTCKTLQEVSVVLQCTSSFTGLTKRKMAS